MGKPRLIAGTEQALERNPESVVALQGSKGPGESEVSVETPRAPWA